MCALLWCRVRSCMHSYSLCLHVMPVCLPCVWYSMNDGTCACIVVREVDMVVYLYRCTIAVQYFPCIYSSQQLFMYALQLVRVVVFKDICLKESDQTDLLYLHTQGQFNDIIEMAFPLHLIIHFSISNLISICQTRVRFSSPSVLVIHLPG